MNQTPVMSAHALDRCREMNISTKVAKRIWRNPSVTRPDAPGGSHRLAVWSTVEPDYAIIVDPDTPDGKAVVITVLYSEEFTRPEKEPA